MLIDTAWPNITRSGNDDKMDVRSDIEGQMQERGIEEAFGY